MPKKVLTLEGKATSKTDQKLLTKKNKNQLSLSRKDIVKALFKCNGIINKAADLLNVNYLKLYKKIQADEEIQEYLAVIRESNVDTAESVLLEQVKSGDKEQVRYFLTHQGKNRGYGVRNKNNSVKPNITINISPSPGIDPKIVNPEVIDV